MAAAKKDPKRVSTRGTTWYAGDYEARGYAPILGVRLLVEERAELERIAREWGITPTGAIRHMVAHAKGLPPPVKPSKPPKSSK